MGAVRIATVMTGSTVSIRLEDEYGGHSCTKPMMLNIFVDLVAARFKEFAHQNNNILTMAPMSIPSSLDYATSHSIYRPDEPH